MKTGKLLMEGWKKNTTSYCEYIEKCKLVGKTEALRNHIPIMTYIDNAYRKYIELCYYLGKQPLNKGAWMRSDSCA